MIIGIIISHGRFAFELANSVQKILGKSEFLFPFSNDDLTAEKLYLAIKESIKKYNDSDCIAFIDLRGGSCWRVAKMLSKDYPKLKILCGVNIPMLISFLTKRESYIIDDLVQILNEDAHRGIVSE